MFYSNRKKNKGFTILEVCIVLAIIAIVISLAVPSVLSALRDAQREQDRGNITTLNQAATRARIQGMTGPGTYGSDKNAALTWYRDNNLIAPHNSITLDRIEFDNGLWEFP